MSFLSRLYLGYCDSKHRKIHTFHISDFRIGSLTECENTFEWYRNSQAMFSWLLSLDLLECINPVGTGHFQEHIMYWLKKKNQFPKLLFIFFLELKILISRGVNFYNSSSPLPLLIRKSVLDFCNSQGAWCIFLLVCFGRYGVCRIITYMSSTPVEYLHWAKHYGFVHHRKDPRSQRGKQKVWPVCEEQAGS